MKFVTVILSGGSCEARSEESVAMVLAAIIARVLSSRFLISQSLHSATLRAVTGGQLRTKVKGAVPVPPDLAVEVISPTDKWSVIIEKVGEYQEAGVKLVWLVDPNSQVVLFMGLVKIPPSRLNRLF